MINIYTKISSKLNIFYRMVITAQRTPDSKTYLNYIISKFQILETVVVVAPYLYCAC